MLWWFHDETRASQLLGRPVVNWPHDPFPGNPSQVRRLKAFVSRKVRFLRLQPIYAVVIAQVLMLQTFEPLDLHQLLPAGSILKIQIFHSLQVLVLLASPGPPGGARAFLLSTITTDDTAELCGVEDSISSPSIEPSCLLLLLL